MSFLGNVLAGIIALSVAWPYAIFPMISIRTVKELYSENHMLGLYRLHCDRWSVANLEWLVQSGSGDRLLADTRFRCRDCGELAEKQVRPPVPQLGGSIAYITPQA